MFKKARFILSSVICFFISVICAYAQESDSITIVTYYPSPYGVYNQLQTNSLGVGDTNGDGNFNAADVPPTTPGATNGDVWIAGNVGIGTTSPYHSMHLNSPIGTAIGLSTDGGLGGAIGSRRLMLGVSAVGPDDFVVGSVAGDSILSAKSGGKLIFGTSLTDAKQAARLAIDTSGDVGIGTTSPGAKLEVKAGAEGQPSPVEAIRIWGPNSPTNSNSAQDLKWDFAAAGSAGIRAYRGGSWDTYLQFLTNAAGQGSDSPQVRMHISGNGNVGIGTTTPQGRLDVVDSAGNGSIRIGGDATCSAAKAGTMRYNAGANAMQYCDGANWVAVGGAAAAGSVVGGGWDFYNDGQNDWDCLVVWGEGSCTTVQDSMFYCRVGLTKRATTPNTCGPNNVCNYYFCIQN